MVKKYVCIALAALVGASAVNAQDNTPARKVIFQNDGLAHHWFLELGASASLVTGASNRSASWGDRVSFINPSIAVGKWFNPYFGARLQVMGGEIYDNTRVAGRWTQGTQNYALAHADVLFDVVNYFSPYKTDRFFHVIPFLGVGGGYRWNGEGLAGNGKNDWTPSAHVGLQLKMRLSKCIDLNVEGQAIAHNFGFGSLATVNGKRRSAMATLGAGLTFHLGKKDFTPITPEDPALLASLNNTLNGLRAENAELRKRPTHCPEPPAPVVEGIAVGNVVYFRIDSDRVDANQMINIRNIAEYAKNNTETITLVGYADRETGTPDYNYALSERRAKAVRKILVEKYGISESRIKIDWKGDREQPYAENVWNRIVLMSAEK